MTQLDTMFFEQLQELTEQEMTEVSGGFTYQTRVSISTGLYYASAVAEAIGYTGKTVSYYSYYTVR